MDLGIQSNDLAVKDLFAPGERLSMPSYQRSFSWRESDTLSLLQDLMEAADIDDLIFIGAIVVNTNGQFNSLEIVDGQQRLTTLTILLCLLRDMEPDPDRAAAIHAAIFDQPDPERGEPGNYRLNLNQLDAEFFRTRIQTPGASLQKLSPSDGPLTGSQRLIAVAAEDMSSILEKVDLEARRRLVDTILARCALVRVTVANRDWGYQVYRVLNTKGREPNAHDIIKTEIFEAARFSRDEADHFSTAWAQYEAKLGAKSFDELLRQVRSLYDPSSRGDVVTGFTKSVLSKVTPQEFLQRDLPVFVEAYSDILTGRMGADAVAKGINDYLHRLRALDHHGWKAPALKFLVERGVADPMAEPFFKRLERLGYFCQLVMHQRDQRDRRYKRVLAIVHDDEMIMGDESPFGINEEEGEKLRERLLGRFATFTQRRTMALRLNAALEGGYTLPIEADATVEHVLPRNPPKGSHWLTTWPDAAKRRELCDTLGNFVLLTHKQNQEADRQVYQEKKRIYFSDGSNPFPLTRDLRDQEAWTAEIVRERTAILASILAQHWELP